MAMRQPRFGEQEAGHVLDAARFRVTGSGGDGAVLR